MEYIIIENEKIGCIREKFSTISQVAELQNIPIVENLLIEIFKIERK